MLAVACAVMGILVANGTFGNSTQYLPITSCQAGTNGCTARSPANFHADFALFINGTQVDLTQSEFAAEANADATVDSSGSTIAVHKQLTTWDSFLRSAHMELNDPTLPGGTVASTCLTMPNSTKYCTTKTNTFKFFVNGVQVDGIVNTDINDLDRVLISYGPETLQQVKSEQLPKLTSLSCKADGRCSTPAS